MITLSNPAVVKNVLGGLSTINYDRLVLDQIRISPIDGSINAVVRISASSDPDQTVLQGNLIITTQGVPFLTLTVQQLDFHRRVQIGAVPVSNLITSTQNSIESGLISLGVIAGTQSTGV